MSEHILYSLTQHQVPSELFFLKLYIMHCTIFCFNSTFISGLLFLVTLEYFTHWDPDDIEEKVINSTLEPISRFQMIQDHDENMN